MSGRARVGRPVGPVQEYDVVGARRFLEWADRAPGGGSLDLQSAALEVFDVQPAWCLTTLSSLLRRTALQVPPGDPVRSLRPVIDHRALLRIGSGEGDATGSPRLSPPAGGTGAEMRDGRRLDPAWLRDEHASLGPYLRHGMPCATAVEAVATALLALSCCPSSAVRMTVARLWGSLQRAGGWSDCGPGNQLLLGASEAAVRGLRRRAPGCVTGHPGGREGRAWPDGD